MLRGAIESVTRNKVNGWIYSPEGSVRERTVLAFVDDTCVGAGKVELYRQDLADAGLGDGHLGFSFFVTLASPTDAGRLIVRLDGSDAVLLQRRSRVTNGVASERKTGRNTRAGGQSLSSLQWMRGRGWLSQSDYDFLRYFGQFGVYDRSLAAPVDRSEKVDVELLDPEDMARELLLLHRMDEAEVRRETVSSLKQLRALAEAAETSDGPGAVIAVWSRQRGRLPVVEGSHTNPALLEVEEGEVPPSVEYALGPDRLLFLDARCGFGAGAALPASGVDVFFIQSL